MKIICVLFVLAFAGSAREDRIHLTPLPLGDHEFAVGVMVDNARDDEQVIVQIQYKTAYPGIDQEILRSSTSVVPAIDGAPAMSDSVPVGPDHIYRVKVMLVKNESQRNFEPSELTTSK